MLIWPLTPVWLLSSKMANGRSVSKLFRASEALISINRLEILCCLQISCPACQNSLYDCVKWISLLKNTTVAFFAPFSAKCILTKTWKWQLATHFKIYLRTPLFIEKKYSELFSKPVFSLKTPEFMIMQMCDIAEVLSTLISSIVQSQYVHWRFHISISHFSMLTILFPKPLWCHSCSGRPERKSPLAAQGCETIFLVSHSGPALLLFVKNKRICSKYSAVTC